MVKTRATQKNRPHVLRPMIQGWRWRLWGSSRGLHRYEPAGLTMAQLDLQTKNLISHRGQALRRARLLIENLRRQHRERNLPFRLP